MPNRIIRYFYYSLFFILPLLMFSKTSELFEFNKILFIYVVSAVSTATLLIYSFLYKNNFFRKTALDRWIILFVGALLASTIFSIDKHTSIYGYYGRFNGGLLSVFSYVALFYVFVSQQMTPHVVKKSVERLLKVSLLSSFIVILWGLSGKIGYDLSCYIFTGNLSNACWSDQFRPAERMFSTLGQPNWLGAYLAANFFIGLYFLSKSLYKAKLDKNSHGLISGVLSTTKDVRVLLYSAYLFICFSGILFTRSRSALLATFIGLLLYGIFMLWHTRSRRNLVKGAFIFAMLVILLPILVFKTGIAGIDRYMSLSQKAELKSQSPPSSESKSTDDITESGDIRKIVWKGAIDLGLKYPLFGTGVETFAYSYYFVRPVEHNLTSEWDFLYNKAHNEYLNYFATTGLVGLISYLLMIIVVCYMFVSNVRYRISKQRGKNQKDDSYEITLLLISLFVSYITILVTNFFGFSTSVINLYFYLIPALLILIVRADIHDSQEVKVMKPTALSYTGSIAVALTCIFYLFSLLNYLRADIKYALANSYDQAGDYQEAAVLYNEALGLRKEHVYQDKFSNVLANLAFIASYNNQDEISTKLVRSSKELNDASIQASPNNSLYWKTKGKNYYLYFQITNSKDDLDTAIAALKKAGELSPTDPKIPYTNAVLYSLLYDLYSDPKTNSLDTERSTEYKKQSIMEINRSISLKPNYQEAYLLKGQLLKKFGMTKEAKEILNNIQKRFNSVDQQVKEELRDLDE